MPTYFKVKDGMLEPWKAWCTLLNTSLRSEALDTLKEEELTSESMTLMEGEYIRGESVGEGLPSNKTRAINIIHSAMKRMCLERAEPLESPDIEVLYLLED